MAVSAATVRRLALSLPEAREAPHRDMTSYRVAGKIFATVPAEGGRVHVFLPEDEAVSYVAEYPGAVEDLVWGARRRGCRIVLARATTSLVRELLTASWRGRASKKLLAGFDA
jgi:hypothetical protein